MKTRGLLHAELNRQIALLAHTDLFVIADSGFPVPTDIPIIDLRVVFGLPTFADVLSSTLAEVTVEAATIAEEMQAANRRNFDIVAATGIPRSVVSHEELKHRATSARFVVRTAENTPYSNVLLRAGVAFL